MNTTEPEIEGKMRTLADVMREEAERAAERAAAREREEAAREREEVLRTAAREREEVLRTAAREREEEQKEMLLARFGNLSGGELPEQAINHLQALSADQVKKLLVLADDEFINQVRVLSSDKQTAQTTQMPGPSQDNEQGPQLKSELPK